MAPRNRTGDPDRWAQMIARIAELEDRVRILEARVRSFSVQSRKDAASTKVAPRAARARPRPRCPGCTLELPKGRRGDSCVWCGFVFSAIGGRAFR